MGYEFSYDYRQTEKFFHEIKHLYGEKEQRMAREYLRLMKREEEVGHVRSLAISGFMAEITRASKLARLLAVKYEQLQNDRFRRNRAALAEQGILVRDSDD